MKLINDLPAKREKSVLKGWSKSSSEKSRLRFTAYKSRKEKKQTRLD